MTTQERLLDLIGQWETSRRQGRETTAEDLCRDCPELLPSLRERIATLHADGGTIRPSDTEIPDTHSDRSIVQRVQSTGAATVDSVRAVADATKGPMVAHLPVVDPQPNVEPIPGFRLVRQIGAGGFGSVWLAEAPGQFPVALKFVMLSGHVGATELRSLEILRHLRHSNLLTTFGAWKNERYLIIAMELADRTLADRLKEAKAEGLQGIPQPELIEYMRAAAGAIDYLNEPRVLVEGQEPLRVQHRDIKPANILLVGSGVKVADFGLARVLEHTMVSHTGGLTPAYAAPEFLQGKTSQHSDQYCLAIAYCELRGGRLPFTGAFADLIMGHVEKAPDLLMLPEQERPVAARALSKNPESRWPSCKKFVEALANANTAGDTAPLSIPKQVKTDPCPIPKNDRTDAVSPVKPSKPRRRGLLIGIAAVIAAALVAGNWNSIRNQFEKPPREKTEVTRNNEPKQSKTPNTKVDEPKKVEAPDKTIDEPKQKGSEVVVKKPKDPPTKIRPKSPMVGERLRFLEHGKAEVRCVALVPTSNQVVSGDSNGILWLWDAVTGKAIRQLPSHTKAAQCVTICPEGRFVLTGGNDATVRFTDLTAPKDIRVLRSMAKGLSDVDMHGVGLLDMQRVISAGNANQIFVWDLDNAKESERWPTGLNGVLCMALDANANHTILGGAKGSLRLRDTNAEAKETIYVGHQDDIRAVAFFPSGEQFVSAGGGDGRKDGQKDYTVRIWAIGEKEPKVTFRGHRAPVECVAVSPDGERILSGDRDGNLLLWNAETGMPYPRFDESDERPNERGAINCVQFRRDGKEAVTGHADGTLSVWVLPIPKN